MSNLSRQGFVLHPAVFAEAELIALRIEADRLQAEAGSACVRRPRERSALFANLSVSERLLALIPEGLAPVRSILFDKTPTENWPVPWHQDLTIAVAERAEVEGYGPWSLKDGVHHVQPPTEVLEAMATIRLHLDHAADDNGALQVIPDSHRLGKLPAELPGVDRREAISCSCQAGDVLVMRPLIAHSSARSQRPDRRRVLHFEYGLRTMLVSELRWSEP